MSCLPTCSVGRRRYKSTAVHCIKKKEGAARKQRHGLASVRVQGARKILRSEQVWGTAATVQRRGRTLGGDRTGRSALLQTSRKITRFNCLTPEHCTVEFVVALPHGRPSTRSMPLSWCSAWLHDNASTYRTCRDPLDAHGDRFLVLCALHMISLHVAARSTPPVAMTARITAYTRRRPNGCQLTPHSSIWRGAHP